jgi:parallel beta-helix repeat protein
MEKKYILYVFLIINSIIYGRQVDENTARLVAKNCYYEVAARRNNLSYENISPHLVFTSSRLNQSLYYVFQINTNDGFIIVTAIDNSVPILGYSARGNFIESGLLESSEFQFWFSNIEEELVYLITTALPPDEEIEESWNAYKLGIITDNLGDSLILPLDTRWDQGEFYNEQCPETNPLNGHPSGGDDGHTLTGCVATSMGQILKYFNYPNNGTGSHSYTDPYNAYSDPCLLADPTYGFLSANYGNTNYLWSSMDYELDHHNFQVAQLLSQCGICVNMDYTYCECGAYNVDAYLALMSNFNYQNSASYITKSFLIPWSVWENMIIEEIDNGRPIIYGGTNSSGGHSWVIQGYKEMSQGMMFAFNWGWGLEDIGFFYLRGSGNPQTYYPSNQEMVKGIQPPQFITVAYPNSKECVLNQGETCEIKWFDNISGNVKIELLRNNVFLSLISNSEPSDGSYNWLIPCNLVPDNLYQIKISSTTNGNIYDISNFNFTLTNPVIEESAWDDLPHNEGEISINMSMVDLQNYSYQYIFDFTGSPTGGTGGSDSDWQTSNFFTDYDLEYNHQYGYRAKARLVYCLESDWTSTEYSYTSIETPSGISFGNATATSLQVKSTNTPSGLSRGNSGLIIYNQANYQTSNSGWKHHNEYWYCSGLNPNTNYGFYAQARNGDGIETPTSPVGNKYTLSVTPLIPLIDNINSNSFELSIQADGNPSNTDYALKNITTGSWVNQSGNPSSTPVWQTRSEWGTIEIVALNPSTAYSFALKSINGDGVESPFSPSANVTTAPPPNNPPSLTNHTLIPYAGQSSDLYTFRITYTDSDNDPPSVKKVYINGQSSTMTFKSGSNTTGAIYEYITTRPVGEYEHYFKFSDGRTTVTSSVYPGPIVVDPDFILESLPTQQITTLTNAGVFKIKTSALAAYSSPINLSVVDLPSHLTAVLNQTSITPGDSTILTITAGDNTSAGTYTFNIRGISGSLDHSASIQMTFVDGTYVSGNQTGTLLLSESPYLVNGNIVVPLNQTLIIQPGVELNFLGQYNMQVYGTLLAQGTREDSIFFTTDSLTTGWGGLKFYSESDNSFLSYCNIFNGIVNGYGGGINAEYSDLIIVNSLISHNKTVGDNHHGGGIYFFWGSPKIIDSEISYNTVYDAYGCGLFISYSSAQVIGCTIKGNYNVLGGRGGGMRISNDATYSSIDPPLVYNTLITGNYCEDNGGGIYLFDSDAKMINCVITNNSVQESDPGDGGGGIYKKGDGEPVIRNCIIRGNTAYNQGNQIMVDANADTIHLGYSNIYNYTLSSQVVGPTINDGGLINADPQFVYGYHLNTSSTSIDAGDPFIIDAMTPPGQDSSLSDMGLYGGEMNYANELKGLYINPSYIDFKQTKTGITKNQTIHIFNYSDTIFNLQNIVNNNPDLQFTYTSGNILPNDSVFIQVSFSPSDTGDVFQLIQFTINSKNVNFKIVGEGVLETTVYGEVSGHWLLADSPINVVDNIYLPANKVLTIDSGVYVVFNGNYRFDVFGNLYANGLQEDTVRFQPKAGVPKWAGIRIYSSQDVIMNYVLIKGVIKNGIATSPQQDRDGGGLFVVNSDIKIYNSRIANNQASKTGGGGYFENSTLDIEGSKFHYNVINHPWGNSGTDTCFGGGGLALRNTICNIDNSIIDHCSVYSTSDQVYGGGISIFRSCKVSIQNSTISYNLSQSADDYGKGGGVLSLINSRTVIVNCLINNNTAESIVTDGGDGHGGGIYSDEAIIISNSIISNNKAKATIDNSGAFGGGIHCYGGKIINSIISSNTAITTGNSSSDSEGGGVFITGGEVIGCLFYNNICSANTDPWGGGIHGNSANMIKNCTFYNNSVQGGAERRGGGIYISGGTVLNTILYGNIGTYGSQIYASSSLPIDYCLIQNHLTTGAVNIAFGPHILDTDPRFINTSINNFHLKSTQYGYSVNSPCINYGHPDHPDACLSETTGLGTSVGDLGCYGGPNNCNDYIFPFLVLEGNSINFDSIYLGDSISIDLKVSNLGLDTLDIDSLAIIGTDSLMYFIGTIFPVSLAPDSIISVTVSYLPTTAFNHTAQLKIMGNNIFGNEIVGLSGTGLEAIAELNPSNLSFGDVLINSSDTLGFYLKNSGNGNLFVNDIVSYSPYFIIGTNELTVTPGDSTLIDVYFNPTDTINYSATASIFSNSDTAFLSFSGIGVAPLLSVDKDSIYFGYIMLGQDTTISLTIHNPGTADLHIQNILATNNSFLIDTTSLTIIPDANYTIDVTFLPQNYQSYSEKLKIYSDADTIEVVLIAHGYEHAFTDAAAQAGVKLTTYSMSSSWADYDLDGYEDLFVTNYNSPSKLFKNNGNGTFVDRTTISFISVNGPAYSGVWGDYDNDGDPDLYVTLFYQPNQLYQNQGDGTFFELSSFAGVNDSGPTKGASWADYNNDGFLDLFVCNYGAANKLYQNQGDGTFINVAPSLGLNFNGQGQIGIWSDYDLDGDQDLYVVNWNNQPNKFYKNNSGSSFSEIASSLGIAGAEKSKSAAWGDFDNDGDPDLYVVNYLGQPNKLYRNDFPNGFTDVSVAAGVANNGYGHGANWCDYDNDGFLDLFLVTFNEDPNILYHNMGDGTFENFSGYAGVDDSPIATSVSFSDYNKDGYIDCYVTAANDTNILYRNTLDINNYLEIELVGINSNKSGIGARIDCWTAGNIIKTKAVESGEGYLCGNSLKQSFGTGSLELIDSLQISWPSGIVQIIPNIETDNSMIILEECNQSQQMLSFEYGWNIFSLNLIPETSDLLEILQPLIDSNLLVRVYDEDGDSIYFSAGNGWINSIGEVLNSEGYSIKVADNCALSITGCPVIYPYEISFSTGWNLIGYPGRAAVNAMAILNQLITNNNLVKVVDEKGGIIQNIPGQGWINTIGDFKPGEGYYIKVNSSTNLTIQRQY